MMDLLETATCPKQVKRHEGGHRLRGDSECQPRVTAPHARSTGSVDVSF